MEKIVDGVELLLMIEKGELENKKVYFRECYYNPETNSDEERKNYLFIDSFGNIETEREKVKNINAFRQLKYYVEDDKEDEKIDIDNIEEVKHIYIYKLDPNVEKVDDRVSKNVEKINELIKAVKQLNKKLEGK